MHDTFDILDIEGIFVLSIITNTNWLSYQMNKEVYFYALIFDSFSCYVGSTFYPKHRPNMHLYDLARHKHCNEDLQYAYDTCEYYEIQIFTNVVSIEERFCTEQACFEEMAMTGLVMLNQFCPSATVNENFATSEAYEKFKKQCKSKAFTDKISKAGKHRFQRPGELERHRKAIKKGYENNFEARRRLSEKSRARWQDDEYRINTGRSISKAKIKQYRNDKDFADRHRAATQTDEFRQKVSIATKEALSKPENKEKLRIATNIIAVKPEVRAKRSASSKAMWQNPEYRKKLQEHNQNCSEEKRQKCREQAKRWQAFVHQYGTGLVCRCRLGTEQLPDYCHYVIPTIGEYVGKVIVFIWDTREVVAIYDVQEVQFTDFCRKIRDSHEPLDFSKVLSLNKIQ